MIYEKDKIRRLIEYKDTVIDQNTKENIEWLIECYNDYYVKSNEYDDKISKYNSVLNKYYSVEDENYTLKERIIYIKKKYKVLKGLYNDTCKNKKSMI